MSDTKRETPPLDDTADKYGEGDGERKDERLVRGNPVEPDQLQAYEENTLNETEAARAKVIDATRDNTREQLKKMPLGLEQPEAPAFPVGVPYNPADVVDDTDANRYGE